jgi:lycopene beta-cyclase
MEPATDVDVVIAGGGLSGLSLAARLATNGWRGRRVLVVDDPAASPPATSWGFWSPGRDLLDAAAERSFGQVQMHAGGVSRVLPLGRYCYRVMRRPDLDRAVKALLDDRRDFTVCAGRVQRVRDGRRHAETTVDGVTIRSRWVFDSVTPPPVEAVVDARLAVTGWDVSCERPAFDPFTPVLFDFRTPQANSARFVYVLPRDPHRALVELAEFVPAHLAAPPAQQRCAVLDAYLREVVRSGGYEILSTESAVLPLRVRPPRRDGAHVLTIGAAGGLIKASTGYAYERIQRDSAAIARSLARHGHPFDRPAPRHRHRLLDAVLLEVLDQEPARLEHTFARLFAHNPAELVLRFLDEDTTVPEELRLIGSLQPAPYLRALLRRGRNAMRH